MNYYRSIIIQFALTMALALLIYGSAYAQQPSGEQLFLTNRCANCHTIGRGTFVGPDLYNVHNKYSKEQIIAWMVNSQNIYNQKGKMPLNEGYPPMPPMNVLPGHAEQISEYIKNFKIPKNRSQKGVIKGVVSNETLKENISDLEVKLTSYLGDISREEFSAKTNSKGLYIFKDLRWDRAYAISIIFKGVEYYTGKLVFSPEESTKTLDLPVYDTSTDDSIITLDSSHIIIQLEEDRAAVAELSVFKNDSNSVYIGNNDINDKQRETLRFNIPQNAVGIQYHQGLTEQTVIKKHGELISTLTVQPGITRVVFSYEIPIQGKTQIIKKLDYLTNSQLVLVSDNGYKADITGLSGGESVEMNNQKFFKWRGDDVKKGHEIKISISKPLFRGNLIKWIMLFIVILVVAAGAVYSQLYKKTQELAQVSTVSDRDRLIKEIAELDDRFEAGDIKESEYKKLREEKKNILMDLIKRNV